MTAAVSAAALGALAAGCGNGPLVVAMAGHHAAAPAAAAASAAATAAAADTTVVALRRLPGVDGPVLAGNGGRTLYLFGGDPAGQSRCSGACVTAWPPYLAAGPLRAGPGVNPALLGTTHRADGTIQVSYDGHPLYYYQGDISAGSRQGEGARAFGGRWYLVTASGRRVTS
jgi:predicted lipoprotein with Yx(FWY)xxD motif